MISIPTTNRIKSTLATTIKTSLLCLSFGAVGWLAGEQLQEKVAQASTIADSANWELAGPTNLLSGYEACTGTLIYENTITKQFFILGSAPVLDKCKPSYGILGSPTPIEEFSTLPHGNQLAEDELRTEAASILGIPESKVMFF